MTKHLPKSSSARSKRSRQGWSPERRARQAELIRRWAPWRRSTGPKTDAGKTRCAMNALKHGYRSQAGIQRLQRVRHAIRLAAQTLELVKLHDRIRNSRPRIKYKFLPPHALRSSESLAMLIARFDRLSSPSAATDQPSNTQTHLPLVGVEPLERFSARRFGSGEGRDQEVARRFQHLRPGTRIAETALPP